VTVPSSASLFDGDGINQAVDIDVFSVAQGEGEG